MHITDFDLSTVLFSLYIQDNYSIYRQYIIITIFTNFINVLWLALVGIAKEKLNSLIFIAVSWKYKENREK